jgi:hypothetical protein
MTQRERFLAIGIGGLAVIVALQWSFSRYRNALQTRQTQLTNLRSELETKQAIQLEGAWADARMGDYLERSLPGDHQRAQGDYQRWLLESGNETGLRSPDVKLTASPRSTGVFRPYTFEVKATGDLDQLVSLLHRFHSHGYLHRIRKLDIPQPGTRTQERGRRITINVDAIALDAASPTAEPPTVRPSRVAADMEYYRQPILQRNFFSPPNQPPRFAGSPRIEAMVGRDLEQTVQFTDPDEGQRLRYELVGEVPSGVRIDPTSGALRGRLTEEGRIELKVRATDDGLPAQSAEQQLVINVVPPPPPEPEAPGFDDATQAVLTGLVQSRGEWTAMVNARTKGETKHLRAGDRVEIGSVRGRVVEVTERYITIEMGDRQVIVRPGASLASAFEDSDVN